ncbi:MAG: L,D-transpeptidase family protein [Atopobium sp.]|uniref:L,D-transpeptidase family protein n=1 Tax=Atopobium sp. TaxID=1872650 RepID=UPI002A7F5986|nr:L,D-transpeptidase family protein [Atopobium sp.]MDY4523111.1 L,D-transpeptidase family protein [Atopobium sp.]
MKRFSLSKQYFLPLVLSLGVVCSCVPASAWATEPTQIPSDEQITTNNQAATDQANNTAQEQAPSQDAQNQTPISGWQNKDGKLFYYHEDGSLHTGWLAYNNCWYWADPSSGQMATGWRYLNKVWYWFSPDGIMAHERTFTEGKWSDFDAFGAWKGYASGWDQREGHWYWLESGTRFSGWKYINNKWYWMDKEGICLQDQIREIAGSWYAFSSSGAMGQNGWCVADRSWCLASSSGALKSGWQSVAGAWYWIHPGTQRMHTGYLGLTDKAYYFKPSGEMALGWVYDQPQQCWYYAQPTSSNGSLLCGWQKLGGKWYWLDSANHKMHTGWLDLGEASYYLEDSGAMASLCWKQRDAQSCWLDGSGRVAVIQQQDQIRFANGDVPQDGLVKLGDSWFYLVGGSVQYGPQTINGKTHLFDATTGKAVCGWKSSEDGHSYYYSEKGESRTGWIQDKGAWYYLSSENKLLTGWQQLNGKWYYFNPQNKKMHTGWLSHNNHWYWLDASGARVSGWMQDKGAWYYLDAEGKMLTGWQQLDGKWYYLNPQSGKMHTGWIFDGKAYYFLANDGHWIKANAQYYDMFTAAQGYSSATNYLICVDTSGCRVAVYYGQHNNWSPIREFICSPGKASTPTIKGEFSVQSKGYVFGHGYSCYYYTQFYGNYLFHSVLYNQGTFTVQDGRLGQHLSHGCVRLAIENAKWIYDYVPMGSRVVVW